MIANDKIQIVRTEEYWKKEGWYRVLINISKIPISDTDAELLLKSLSNRWTWNEGKFEAHSTHTVEGTNFTHPQIRFINVWFEELIN